MSPLKLPLRSQLFYGSPIRFIAVLLIFYTAIVSAHADGFISVLPHVRASSISPTDRFTQQALTQAPQEFRPALMPSRTGRFMKGVLVRQMGWLTSVLLVAAASSLSGQTQRPLPPELQKKLRSEIELIQKEGELFSWLRLYEAMQDDPELRRENSRQIYKYLRTEDGRAEAALLLSKPHIHGVTKQLLKRFLAEARYSTRSMLLYHLESYERQETQQPIPSGESPESAITSLMNGKDGYETVVALEGDPDVNPPIRQVLHLLQERLGWGHLKKWTLTLLTLSFALMTARFFPMRWRVSSMAALGIYLFGSFSAASLFAAALSYTALLFVFNQTVRVFRHYRELTLTAQIWTLLGVAVMINPDWGWLIVPIVPVFLAKFHKTTTRGKRLALFQPIPSQDRNPDVIRQHFQKILNSKTFAKPTWAKKYLVFVMDRFLANEKVTWGSIAKNVFEIQEPNPSHHGTRITQTKEQVQSKLRQYYYREGKDDLIRIMFNRREYWPQFLRRTEPLNASRQRRIEWSARATGWTIIYGVAAVPLHFASRWAVGITPPDWVATHAALIVGSFLITLFLYKGWNAVALTPYKLVLPPALIRQTA